MENATQTLDELRMSNISNRPRRAEKVVKVGSIVAMRFPGGKWWANTLLSKSRRFRRLDRCSHDLLKALYLLEIISKKMLDGAISLSNTRKEKEDREYAASEIGNYVKEYGRKWVKSLLK